MTDRNPEKLRELIEAELERVGLGRSTVRLAFHTVMVFKDPVSKKATPEVSRGQVLDFLDSLGDGDVTSYAEFAEQLEEFLGDEDEEEDDDDDEEEEPADEEEDDDAERA